MAYIQTEIGTCNTDGLLTVSKSNTIVYGSWVIVLKYKTLKDDQSFRCKDEKQADECLALINKGLTDLNTPSSGLSLE